MGEVPKKSKDISISASKYREWATEHIKECIKILILSLRSRSSYVFNTYKRHPNDRLYLKKIRQGRKVNIAGLATEEDEAASDDDELEVSPIAKRYRVLSSSSSSESEPRSPKRNQNLRHEGNRSPPPRPVAKKAISRQLFTE